VEEALGFVDDDDDRPPQNLFECESEIGIGLIEENLLHLGQTLLAENAGEFHETLQDVGCGAVGDFVENSALAGALSSREALEIAGKVGLPYA